jgi:hypothetical protein
MFPVLAGNSASGYNLTRSLRTRASAGAYLNRTPATTTNRQTWTWSAWVKRGSLGSIQNLFAEHDGGTSDAGTFYMRFETADTLSVNAYTLSFRTTTQVFRDPSAWYHIVLVLDTPQATALDRLKLYVNGSQITAFSTTNNPTQNTNYGVNLAAPHYIGRSGISATQYFDGYLAEVNFIDGQALTPASFGSTNTLTGVWQPAAYTGTYGTNGFYLPFTDNSTAAALGTDFSGNSNTWTVNNISVTAGVTYDSMTDVPTLTSATAANYAVLNPLDNLASTIVNGNLGFTTATTVAGNINSTIWASSGKWYYEVVTTNLPSEFNFGICSTASGQAPTSGRYGFDGNPFLIQNSAFNAGGFTFAANDVLGVAYDLDAGTIAAYKNNVLQVTLTGVPAGTYTPFVADSTSGATGCTGYINFGQRPFAYTPPTGFVALNTFNLPTATILKGNTVMDATLYTGNGSTQTITNAVGFQPDFIWLKSRSGAGNSSLTDSVRGVNSQLFSSLTNAEGTQTDQITAFNSNGFSLGANVAGTGSTNVNAVTYVGWQWQGGQGSSSSNAAGSITSTVSVNASAGFSIATYTTPASGSFTVGHGLGVAPKFIIAKVRNVVGNWGCYHASLGNTNYILLNSISAAVTDSGAWGNTSPSSSVITFGSASFWGGNYNYVAYCWSEIDGFSKFGLYTGNGSTNGPFVYTGFRPRWVMWKSSSATGSWSITDTDRSPINVTNLVLRANLSDADTSSGTGAIVDFLSNGFKFRNTGTDHNTSGATYIYMAFAENPFKNALAR